MSTITTYTGRRFDPTAPDAEQLDIRDIAHALSMTCRGNGHVKQFFSVGQHCLRCAGEARARGLSTRIALACLLHDASEAYMSDVPRPFKKSLPSYIEAEDRLLELVYARFLGSPLTAEEAAAVKRIDDEVLYFDLRDLLNDPPAGPAPEMRMPFVYTVPPFAQVEAEYLALYETLKREL